MSKKPMQFQVNGKPLSLTAKPAGLVQATRKLDNLSDGELLEAPDAANFTGFSQSSFKTSIANQPEMKEYRTLLRFPRRHTVYGNKRTIKELLKHTELISA